MITYYNLMFLFLQVDSRGALGSFLQLFNSAGFLPIYFIGPFASYSTIAYGGCLFVAVFCIGMIFMPESPMYHLTKSKKSLIKFN